MEQNLSKHLFVKWLCSRLLLETKQVRFRRNAPPEIISTYCELDIRGENLGRLTYSSSKQKFSAHETSNCQSKNLAICSRSKSKPNQQNQIKVFSPYHFLLFSHGEKITLSPFFEGLIESSWHVPFSYYLSQFSEGFFLTIFS